MLNRMLCYADAIVKRGVDKLIDAIAHSVELQTINAETQAQNATSNGGDASRVGKIYSYYLLVEFVFPYILYSAGRVALSLQQLSGAAANLQKLLNRTL